MTSTRPAMPGPIPPLNVVVIFGSVVMVLWLKVTPTASSAGMIQVGPGAEMTVCMVAGEATGADDFFFFLLFVGFTRPCPGKRHKKFIVSKKSSGIVPLIPLLITGIFFTSVHAVLAWYALLKEGIAGTALTFCALAAVNACSTGIIVTGSLLEPGEIPAGKPRQS